MIPKRHLQVAVAASLVALCIVGCGTEGPDDVVTDDDPLGETAQAGTPRKCVNIIQKHDGAALGYSYSSDSVFTDPLGRPPSAQFAWCLTPSAVLCTLVRMTSCVIGASRVKS